MFFFWGFDYFRSCLQNIDDYKHEDVFGLISIGDKYQSKILFYVLQNFLLMLGVIHNFFTLNAYCNFFQGNYATLWEGPLKSST